jgi:hypothetical protein
MVSYPSLIGYNKARASFCHWCTEAGAGAHLALLLFGVSQAMLDGKPVTGFESNKTRVLLAYLAVEADKSHHGHRGLSAPIS